MGEQPDTLFTRLHRGNLASGPVDHYAGFHLDDHPQNPRGALAFVLHVETALPWQQQFSHSGPITHNVAARDNGTHHQIVAGGGLIDVHVTASGATGAAVFEPCAWSAPGEIRTHTGWCLRPLPLPLGYRGRQETVPDRG